MPVIIQLGSFWQGGDYAAPPPPSHIIVVNLYFFKYVNANIYS